MKIAIASAGNSLSSKVDKRFGRCSYFAIYDQTTSVIDFIPNPAKESDEGAGLSAIDIVVSNQITKIISGEFGIKIKDKLDSLKIQMIVITESNTSILDIINKLNH